MFEDLIPQSRVGLFSDIHIGLGQNSTIWHENILDFAKWTKQIFLSNKIKTIIIPGDIFHNRNEISVQTLNIAKDFFEILKEFQIIISTGNHDCYYKDRSDINSISIFNNWSNIHIVDKTPFLLECFDKKISFIPWGTSLEHIPNADICFGHFEINSFKYNGFAECTHGITSAELLKKSPLIISGHFHTKDDREYSNGRIVYLGSPFQQNFGDCLEQRGIYIFDIKTNATEFIENNTSPKHFKISLKNILEKKINQKFLSENIPGNMICLLVDTNESTEHISRISAKLQEMQPKFYRVDYKIDNCELSITDGDNSSNNYSHLNIEKSIGDFVNNLNTQYKTEVVSYLTEKYNKFIK